MSELDVDLNKTIASAINAKIEASVLAAISGDEVLGSYVTAALQQEVQIGSTYDRKKTTFLHSVVMKAVQQAIGRTIERLIQEESELIEEEVRKAFRREAPALAKQLVDHLGEKTIKNSYGINVELRFPNNY